MDGSGSVELKIEIGDCTFNNWSIYNLRAYLNNPQPSKPINEPGNESDEDEEENESLDRNFLLKTDSVGPANSPKFLINKFVFRVPCIHRQFENHKNEEYLVFTLNFELFEENEHSGRKRLIASGQLQSSAEISRKLLGKRAVISILYLSKSSSLAGGNKNQVFGSIEIHMSLNIAREAQRKSKTFRNYNEDSLKGVVKKKGNELKLQCLLREIRKAGEIHLRALNETSKFSKEQIIQQVINRDQENNLKKDLIERLLREVDEKKEVIETLKRRIVEMDDEFREKENKIASYDARINEMKHRQREIQKQEGFRQIAKLRKKNSILFDYLKKYEYLSKAHFEQNKMLVNTQKLYKKNRKYKNIAKKQEMIIKKLESVFRNEFGKDSGKIVEPRVLIRELSNHQEDLENEIEVKEDEIRMLEEELEKKDTRLKELTKEMNNIARKAGKEIGELRIKCANNGIDYLVQSRDLELIPDESTVAGREKMSVIMKSIEAMNKRKEIFNPRRRSRSDTSVRPERRKSKTEFPEISLMQKSNSGGELRNKKIPSIATSLDSIPKLRAGDNFTTLGSEYNDISLPALSFFNSYTKKGK